MGSTPARFFVFSAWRTPAGLSSAVRKHGGLMSYRNIIVFLSLITFQVNYIATRFLLYDTAAKSVCASLGLKQASHPHTWCLSPRPPPLMASGPPVPDASSSFNGSWVLGGGQLYSGSTSHLVLEVLPCEVQWGIGAPHLSPDSPLWPSQGGLSRMGPPGLTVPVGLSWEPRQETGPAVGPGAGDRTVLAQGSRGLGSECHGDAEAPHHPQWSIHLILGTTP